MPEDDQLAAERIAHLRTLLPPHVAIGISQDMRAAKILRAGCDLWFSALAGLFPNVCQKIITLSRAGQHTQAIAALDVLKPFWMLSAQYGELRVMATLARELGLTEAVNLPLPLLPLDEHETEELKQLLPLLH